LTSTDGSWLLASEFRESNGDEMTGKQQQTRSSNAGITHLDLKPQFPGLSSEAK
jgi:hypothetical protein